MKKDITDTFKKFDLSGKRAFITGGGTGIGYGMARALLNAGAQVMIAARREEVLIKAAAKLAEETRASNNQPVLYTALDLADNNSITAAANDALAQMGGVDIFIGNAGQEVHELIGETKDTSTAHLFQVNTGANITLTRLFLPSMREQQWGRVIYSSSVNSIVVSPFPFEGQATYGATKGALNAFTRQAAGELGRDNITVNALNLGTFMTEMAQETFDNLDKNLAQELMQSTCSMVPLGRFADCKEVEGLTLLLASNAGSYITGTSYNIDGGMACKQQVS